MGIKMVNRKRRSISSIASIGVSVALIVGGLAGCGKGGQEQDELSMEPVKGRYVETEIQLPGEWEGASVRQIFRAGEQVRFLLQCNVEGGASLQEWTLQEDGTLQEITGEWLSDVNVPWDTYVPLKLLQDGEGDQYLFICYPSEGEDFYQGHLWRSQGEEVVDITPREWKEPSEETGYYRYPQDITVTESGILVCHMGQTLDTYLGQDGSLLDREAVEDGTWNGTDRYGQWIESVGDQVYRYTCDSLDTVTGIQVTKQGEKGKSETIPFSQEKSGSVYFSVLPEGDMVALGPDGLFCCQAGDTNWKKQMDGADGSTGLLDLWCTGMTALPDGTVYALFGSEQGNRLMQYRYDPDAVIEITETLRLFTVQESYLLQQAAARYHREHPEVLIQIESAWSIAEGYRGTPDYQEIFQKLNTELMAGNGADILVMDHLDIETYASKGLLVDLEGTVGPMEEDGTLLANITGGYRTPDGRRYAVPLQFGLTMAVGRGILDGEICSMEALADTLSGRSESCMGPQTVEELVDQFYPYFVEEIVKEKVLDKEALGKRLIQLKEIGENCGILERREGKDNRRYNIWDMADSASLAFHPTSGFQEAMWPVSIAAYVKGEYTCFEGTYQPKLEMGINSSSPYRERAEDFLQFALSGQVQDMDYYEGFPVNAVSLEKLAAADRSAAEAYTSIDIGEGASDELAILDFSSKEAERILNMCRSLHTRYREDAKIREELILALPGYLDGTISLEETLLKIEKGLNMYLAE